MTDLAPTPERIAKDADWQRPIVSPTENVVAYRAVGRFESLHRRDQIDYEQRRAGEKLQKHYEGMHGADVRSGEADGPSDFDSPEEARFYHGQQVHKAAGELLPQEWAALVALMVGKRDSIEQIGRDWTNARQPQQARAYGTALVANALDRLCYLWGFKTRDVARRQHVP